MVELAEKGGEMVVDGLDGVKSGLNSFGGVVKDIIGDVSGPIVGLSVTITTDGPAGPNGSYLPDTKDRSLNYHVDQALIDGAGSIAKGGPPGARASNSPAINPGQSGPGTLPVGEAVNGTVGAAVPALQAAQAVFGPSQDSLIQVTPDTTNNRHSIRTATSPITGQSSSKKIEKPIEEVNN